MVAHLEGCPEARVVVNFAPVLLEQLDDYVRQLDGWLERGLPMQDGMLNLLAGVQAIPTDLDARHKLLLDCRVSGAAGSLPAVLVSRDHGRPGAGLSRRLILS